MKRIIILSTLCVLSTTMPNVNAVERDKQYHLGISAVVGATTQYHTADWKTSMIVCTTVGLLKEVKDEIVYSGFDTKDLAYDVVGCTVGVLIGETGLYLFKEKDVLGIGYKLKF